MESTAATEAVTQPGIVVDASAHATAQASWLHEPLLWVTVAFVTFLVLFSGRLKQILVKALDARAAKIAAELEQAQLLRKEAEALKERYQQKLRESVKEAESIITEARAQAARMVSNAEAEIKELLEQRLQQMSERIDQQEQSALDEVRDHIVDITIAAAKSLIIQHFDGISSEQMVRQVIADLDRKVH